jgi:TetR/AcrR family transcriptional regulator
MEKIQEQETEEIILNAAMEEFIDKGRHGAKMQNIANRAGVNKALLHYYYRSKEKLYAKIFKIVYKRFFSEFIKLINNDKPFLEILRSFIPTYMNLLNKNPKIPLFIMKELSEGGETVHNVLKREIDDGKLSYKRFDMIIQQAVDKGEIVALDPHQLIATIIGSCLFFFIAEPIFTALVARGSEFDREKFIKERQQAVYETITMGIIPRGDANGN